MTSPIDFAAGLILALAEVYCITMMFLSLFSVAQPVERKKAPRLSDEEAPTVDVFVPSYNESLDIVATTLAAAKSMDYAEGKLTVYLLDDGATDEKLNSENLEIATRAANRKRAFQALCEDLGVVYLARERNEHAKAGNLNHGLAASEGELVLVLDADHVPARHFLRETVGHFRRDPKLFLVQTPHFFLNPDPIEKNIGFAGMPAENEMFYGLVQKGLDKWNAAFFCGSAAVLRRTALDEVGGFQGSSVTEDAESALELHSRGWNSLYVDTPMISGLQPETFAGFIGQRTRWCRGMIQILLLKNPLFIRGLTLAQRLCYLSSSMFWLFPLSRIVFIFAPMAYIFFDLKIYMANGSEFLAYTVTYMLSALLIQSYTFGRVRWPWTSDLYEYIQAVMLFPAVLGVLINPRRPKFNVTAKGQTLDDNKLSTMAGPYFGLFALVAASLVALTHRFLHEPDQRALIIVVGIWSVLNLLLTGLALGAVSETRERRVAPRVDVRTSAELSVGDRTFPARIENMSTGGFRARVTGTVVLAPQATGVLRLRLNDGSDRVFETPFVNLRRKVSGENRGFGLKFYGLDSDRFRIVAKIVYGDIGGIYAGRKQGYRLWGVAFGSSYLAFAATRQILRGFFYLIAKRNPSADATSRLSVQEGAAP